MPEAVQIRTIESYEPIAKSEPSGFQCNEVRSACEVDDEKSAIVTGSGGVACENNWSSVTSGMSHIFMVASFDLQNK